jgi:Ti-type conjugative transfer relaxase TraA
MAIEFARVEYIKRSDGKNACCKAAYNARARIPDKSTNVTYTFERLKDNVYHEILLPFYVNERFKNVAELANEVEQKEKKSNSQLFKEYVLALPDNKEINLEDRVELTRRFIEEAGFVEEGLGVQFDVHRPHDGEKNWHAHLLVTTRRFAKDGQSLDQKARDLDPKVRGGQKHYILDESKNPTSILWKKIQDQYFAEKGLSISVDERNATTQAHLGPVRMRAIMQEPESAISDVQAAIAISSANELLEAITKQRAVFSLSDIERQVAKIADQVQRQKILTEVKSSDELLSLYRKEDATQSKLYTTKTVRGLEERIMRIADSIKASNSLGIKIPAETLDKSSKTLNEQQSAVLQKLLQSQDGIVVLQGRAGTGKSHVLGVLNSILKDQQRQVIAIAPTLRAASQLKEKGFDATSTIKGFLFKYRNGKIQIKDNSLLIVDEAGMVDSNTYLELLKVAKSNNARMLLAGDDKQLSSIETGGMFSIFAQKYGAVEMDKIERQQNEPGRSIAESFAKGDVKDGIFLLNKHKKLLIANDKQDSLNQLLQDWSKSKQSILDRLILTISNKDVDIINDAVRGLLKKQGYVYGQEYEVSTLDGSSGKQIKTRFAMRDRIVITKSDKEQSLQNGDFGQIVSVSKQSFSIMFDDGRKLEIDPNKAQFKHGYAATVYKSQGASIKDVFVLHDGFSSKENAYVQMSRHVEDLRLYCNLKTTKNAQELARQMQKASSNISSLHYDTKEQRDKRFAPESTKILNKTFNKVASWVKEKSLQIGDMLHSNDDYYVFKAQESQVNKVEEVRQQTMQEISKAETLQAKQGEKGQTRQEPVLSKELANINDNKPKEMQSEKEQKQAVISHQARAQEKYRKWNDQVERIRYELKFKAESLAIDLLGEPNKHISTKAQLRFGQQGKMAVDISGKRCGMWIDFAQGSGGDLLELIMREKGVDFKGALTYAQSYTSTTKVLDSILHERQNRLLMDNTKQQQKERQLEQLCKSTKPLDELGIKYLRNRSIIGEASKDICMLDKMWHGGERQNLPAIVAFARDDAGQITGAGCIYLDKNLAQKADINPAKRLLGTIKGSFVEIQAQESQKQQQDIAKITILAEGLETALSLKEARLPGKILCALGVYNLKNYKPAKDEIVIIAADNDGSNSPSKKALDSAICSLKECGAKTYVVMPKELGEKNIGEKDIGTKNTCDFNDILQQPDGFRAIQQQFMPVIAPYLSAQANAEISALHSSMTQSGRTAKEAMREIAAKHQYLLDSWAQGSPLSDKSFGVTDFEGKKHTNTTDYLIAVGSDPKIKDLIDYQSKLGQEIQQNISWYLNRDRSLSL